jgi:hypothetical protein
MCHQLAQDMQVKKADGIQCSRIHRDDRTHSRINSVFQYQMYHACLAIKERLHQTCHFPRETGTRHIRHRRTNYTLPYLTQISTRDSTCQALRDNLCTDNCRHMLFHASNPLICDRTLLLHRRERLPALMIYHCQTPSQATLISTKVILSEILPHKRTNRTLIFNSISLDEIALDMTAESETAKSEAATSKTSLATMDRTATWGLKGQETHNHIDLSMESHLAIE